ncbi:hypothetical protein R2325_02665 [Mycobacteroides chelonae]|nr:hypothetical protein [Mycobacteroides chelonae]MEC4869470.1 hypothetical protein [Mycobacteroides chelonae]
MSDVQQETCYCYSIVRDDKGRLQCLKHGDVTGRHGDERIGKVLEMDMPALVVQP